MNRRQFLATAASVTCACALCPMARALPTGPVDLGPISDFPHDGVWGDFVNSYRILLVRQSGRLFAPYAACTHHKGGSVRPRDGMLVCAKHGSHFATTGEVLKGPAVDPLPRCAIKVENGRVIVDATVRFDRPGWNDPAAFVSL